MLQLLHYRCTINDRPSLANGPLVVYPFAVHMSSHHLENGHLARTPAGGSSESAYPSEPFPQNFPWRATPHHCPAGFTATANPEYVPGPRFASVVHLLPNLYDSVYLTLSQAPGDPYRTDDAPLNPWRVHSDALKQIIRNLMLQVDSEVVEVRKESHGLSRSRVTVVFEIPDEI